MDTTLVEIKNDIMDAESQYGMTMSDESISIIAAQIEFELEDSL